LSGALSDSSSPGKEYLKPIQRTTGFYPFLVPVPRRENSITSFAGLSALVQRLPSAWSSSAELVSAETKPIFQI